MQKDADLDVQRRFGPRAKARRSTARRFERPCPRWQAAQLSKAQLPEMQPFGRIEPQRSNGQVGERRIRREDLGVVAPGLALR